MILLMGIAGSGKGTQGQFLVDQHGYHAVVMGDVVRAEMTDDQRARVLQGDLLRDDEIIAMLDASLAKIDDLNHVLLDGFPRTVPQAEWLLDQAQGGRFEVKDVFHLVASREAVKARLLDRARADDNDAAIEKRFDEYEKATAPIIEWLEAHGVKVVNINAEQPVEKVSADIMQQLEG
ncbi:MAG TPA: nucleoside monophosphate kinase [Candidatus Saccharimonadales bacterium]|nr:nucleoside monophosphate kinase [Candidatus Saccharimonadales bacterium]